jgi:hypothetical protein
MMCKNTQVTELSIFLLFSTLFFLPGDARAPSGRIDTFMGVGWAAKTGNFGPEESEEMA